MQINSIIYIIVAVTALFLYSYPYVRDILRWKTIPHPFTFLIFFILTSLNTYILYQSNSWFALIPIVLELIIFLVYIYFWTIYFHKIQKISYFDYICFIWALSCIGVFIFLWPLEAVIATIVIDTLALLPTLKKVFYQPETETAIMWGGSATFFCFLVLAIDNHSFENTLFWIYLFFADALTCLYIVYFQYFHKKSSRQ